jgi:hypothetical protein
VTQVIATTWWNIAHSRAMFRRSRTIRAIIKDSVAGVRISTHSAQANTLPLIIEAFEKARIPYRITAVPGLGYTVERYEPHYLIKKDDQDE